MTREESNKRIAEMRAYKAEGHTMLEVAAKYGMSKSYTHKICAGIASQAYKTRFQSGTDTDERVDRFREMLAATNPRLEYVGGYKTVDSYVTLRCLDCGGVFERSCVSIRHGRRTVCPYCKRAMVDQNKAVKDAEKEAARAKAEEERERRSAARREALAKEQRLREERRKHACPVCGEVTRRRIYCSDICARKAANTSHEARRRVRITAALVDKDITLAKLYDRDGGLCWVCGMACSWDDATTKGDTFIAGELYPSVDHVVALCDGGAHSWDNVRLAHRRCNSWRYRDEHVPPFA